MRRLKQVTARQAMAADIASQPEMKKYLKAQKAAKKAAKAAEEEEVMLDLYGHKVKCEDCGLHFRTKRDSNKCLGCAGEEAEN